MVSASTPADRALSHCGLWRQPCGMQGQQRKQATQGGPHGEGAWLLSRRIRLRGTVLECKGCFNLDGRLKAMTSGLDR